MYQSLYRKYRPTNFDEVVGQKVVVQILKNSILNNTISHAYLFSGPRGTGKTSIAKILSKIVNCTNLNGTTPCEECVNCTLFNNKQSTDIIEIDAASNNGVDEIRELKNKINLVPSNGKYKIYIIDEVHMLSTGAFNALLKTLEEPPSHIIFILATTDLHKIPATILSRCQHLEFKKLSNEFIIEKLKYVIKQENIKIDNDDVLRQIAIISDGGMRDALGLLEEVISYSDHITIEDIHEINGTITDDTIQLFLNYIETSKTEEIFSLIENFNNSGKDFYKITEQIINFIKNKLIAELKQKNKSSTTLYDYVNYFNESLLKMKNNSNYKIIFELTIIGLLNLNTKPTLDENTNKLKNIRINNTLCKFNKKEFLNFKEELLKYKNNIKSDYEQLIYDGEIKAFGNNNFIIMYKSRNQAEQFNSNYKIIDTKIKSIMKEDIKGIAVDEIEWNKIKEEFNNKTKTYIYMDEKKEMQK